MVIGYYAGAFFLAVAWGLTLHSRFTNLTGILFPVLTLFTGILGGVRPGGPVRPYSPALARTAYSTPLTQLFLTVRQRASEDGGEVDERDRAVRDRVHYQAMSTLRLGTFLFLAIIAIAVTGNRLWMRIAALEGSYVLFILAMTLPQAILLWTEPDSEPEPTILSAPIPHQENRHA
jgi:hypothetical protein